MTVNLQDLIDAHRLAVETVAELDMQIAQLQHGAPVAPPPEPKPLTMADWHFFRRLRNAMVTYEATA